jgi:predicted nucleic-acid-binding Zn-ribbon protein
MVSKTQKKSKSGRSQRGKGLFTTNTKKYTNLRYKNRNFELPKLVCTKCNSDEFKHKKLKLGTKMKSFLLDTDAFDNTYGAFTCTNCGFVQFYSENTKYNSEKSQDSRRKSK